MRQDCNARGVPQRLLRTRYLVKAADLKSRSPLPAHSLVDPHGVRVVNHANRQVSGGSRPRPDQRDRPRAEPANPSNLATKASPPPLEYCWNASGVVGKSGPLACPAT